jgi:hypothetical protein
MAAKKNPAANKSAFVRTLPASMPAADVVKAAAAKGIAMTDKYVHTIRYNAKKTGRKKSARLAPVAAAPAKRRPGRPRKNAVASSAGSASHGLIAELEAMISRIVEQKVTEILKARLAPLAS